MTDGKVRTELKDRLEQGSLEPVEQQTQQSQASAEPPAERRIAPGRMPLFRR